MPLVSSSISNLVNGVSQQPYTLRLASQAEIQENGLSTVSQGLKKRPPTKHVKKIIGTPLTNAYVHTINRDTVERYTVIVKNGDLFVYDMDGTAKTVDFPDGKGYLSASNPRSDFRAITVADYTFLVNKTVTVGEAGTMSPTRPFEAIVVVKSGQYGKSYTIQINGNTEAVYDTPDGSSPAHTADIATNKIAEELKDGLVTNGFTATRSGSVIYITRGTDFTITCSDGFGNTAMIAVKGQIQRFSDLPPVIGTNGFTLHVVGDQSSSFDDYWVKFDTSGGTGVWKETVEPDIKIALNPATMPYVLIREAGGTFTFRRATWSQRTVGDDGSAPMPSFVNRKITDVFFYRNRLGFIADESVLFSEAGKFFNFFPTTVTALLDGDPIDISVSHVKVANLTAAVPFSRQLILFSAQTQFAVEAGDILTGKTVSVKPTTEFESSTTVRPVGVGRNIYFAVPKGDYSGVREYSIDQDTVTEDAADVTSHVPEYVPKNIFKLAAALNEDILLALSVDSPSDVFVYKFYWNNNEKLQSAWSKWKFAEGDTVLNVDFLESQLVLTISRSDGVYLETMNVSSATELAGEPYLVHLDRKKTIPRASLSYSSGYTIITPAVLGWEPTDGPYLAVTPTGQPKKAGLLMDVVWDGTNAKVLGNFTDSDLIIGRKYAYLYRFSILVPRARTQTGERADTLARLQLRDMQVQYSNSGYFQARVTPYGRPTYTYTFSGKTLGLPSSTIGEVNLETGSFRFPIMSRNTTVDIELYSDSPLPCAFLSADWEGFYVKRSKGI